MNHIVTLERGTFGGIRIVCSCDPDGYIGFADGAAPVLLDWFNEIAHEHIESAEKMCPSVTACPATPSYGVKSAPHIGG